eukprot:97499_1
MTSRKKDANILVFTGDYRRSWAINTQSISKFERKCIIQCHQKLTTAKCNDSTINTAVRLVKKYPHSAEYKFLCGLCYRDVFIPATLKDKKTQYEFVQSSILQYDYDHYYKNSQFYFKEALRVLPNHPVFLYYYSMNLNYHGENSLSFELIDKLRSLFENNKYVAKWKNHEQIPCYDTFQCHFQFLYINAIWLDKRLIPRVWKHMNDLFSKFIKLQSTPVNDFPMAKWTTSYYYSVIYSSVGKYKQAYKAFKFYYSTADRTADDMYPLKYLEACFHTSCAVNKYSKCANMLMFLFRFAKRHSEHNYIHILYAYLYRLAAEIAIYNQWNQNKIMLRDVNRYVTRKLIKDETNRNTKFEKEFGKIIASEEEEFAYICMIYYKSVCKDQTCKQMFRRQSRYSEQMWYISGILSIAIDFEESIKSFMQCLMVSYEKYIRRENKDSVTFLKSDIPLSYFYSGLNSLKLEQYQIAIKLFRKAHQITKDIKIINRNHKQFIKKCKVEIGGKRCDYCGVTGKKLRSCKGCAIRFYCSRICQKMDWKIENHRAKCSKFWIGKYEIIATKYNSV